MSVCKRLITGQNILCSDNIKHRYYQRAVLINKGDILPSSIKVDVSPGGNYTAEFELLPNTRGYLFGAGESGNSYFGTVDKTTSELGGIPQYKHNANIIVVGIDGACKNILDALSWGSFVVAYQFSDGTVEVYGLNNGMVAGDFTYDPQGGGGGSAIVLSSLEIAPEPHLPYVYKSKVVGGERADFDSCFSAAGGD